MTDPDKRITRFARVFCAGFVAAVTLLLMAFAAGRAFAAQAALPVSQTAADGVTVTYTLTPRTSGAPMPAGGGTFSLTSDATATLTFDCERAGTWTYDLTATGSNAAVSPTTYTVTVRAVNTAGGLAAEVSAIGAGATNGRKAVRVTFTIDENGNNGNNPGTTNNTTNETRTDAVSRGIGDPSVRKVIKGDTPSTDATFTFTMTADDAASAAYMPPGSVGRTKTVTVRGEGTREFGNLYFDKTGTYNYTVREVRGSAPGYTYDSTVYQARFVVTRGTGNTLNVRRFIYSGGRFVTECSKCEITFTNHYSKTGAVKTGDASAFGVYFVMLAGAGAALVVSMTLRRRTKGGMDAK